MAKKELQALSGGIALGMPELKITAPPEITRPIETVYGRQLHKALRAGEHRDFRIVNPKDPNNMALSWWVKHWPKPGEIRKAGQTFDHMAEYLPWEGTILKGRGAGKVELEEYGSADIISSNPNKITIATFPPGSKKEELYTLVRTKGDQWLILNRTPKESNLKKIIPDYKPTFKDIKMEDIDYGDNNQLIQEKLDGFHTLNVLGKPGEPIMMFSWGRDKKGNPIPYHAKFRNLWPIKTPPEHANSILRGELIFVNNKTGKAIPIKEQQKIMLSDIEKGRRKQDAMNVTPKIKLHDVVTYKGGFLENEPYAPKFEILEEIVKDVPGYSLPLTAKDPQSKKRLVKDIEQGLNRYTSEGIVIRELTKSEPIIKRAKIRPTSDIYVKEVNYNEKGQVASLGYALKSDGLIVGKVNVAPIVWKEDVAKNPERWINHWIEIESAGQFPDTGAYRQPSIVRESIDRNISLQS